MIRTRNPFARALAVLVLAGVSAAALGASGVEREAQASEDERERLVTIVATGEPETQLMAMVLTMQSVQQGAEARILLCGPGARMAWKDAPASATAPQKPRDMSPQGLMAKLVGMGVRTEVCAIHLPNAGKTEADLIEGVGVAQPPEMAAGIMAEDVRVLSF
jgi:predicted peroxiredoxin